MRTKETFIRLCAIFMLELILFLPVYHVQALRIIDVSLTPGGEDVLVSWSTDQDANGTAVVQSGVDSFMAHAGEFTKNHSVTINGLDSERTYSYNIFANTMGGATTNEFGQFTTRDITPPARPTGVTAVEINRTKVIFNWVDVDDSDFLRYLIYRDNIRIANTTDPYFTDTGLTPQTAYTYEVAAIDHNNNTGERSDPLQVTTLEPDTTPPHVVNVTLSDATPTSITVNWEMSEAANCTLMYGTTSAVSLKKESPDVKVTHSANIDNLNTGTLYYYVISCCDMYANCAERSIDDFVASEESASVTTQLVLPEFVDSSKFRITGTTEPYTELKVYVNDDYKAFISRTHTADGNVDYVVFGLSEGSNTVKIVAEDGVGSITQSEHTIISDQSPPQYTINAIPKIIREQELVMTGSVNEPCTITFTVEEGDSGNTALSQVTGLTNTAVGTNSLTISWDDLSGLKDFRGYLIYRNNTLLTETTDNEFIDAALDTDSEHTYEIAVIDNNCRTGQRSDSLTLRTMPGGQELDINVTPYDLSCESRSSTVIETSSTFSQSLSLFNGHNTVIINISDRAGNMIYIENETYFDEDKPVIEKTNLDKLSPSYTRDITVEGKVSEKATVYASVNVKGNFSTKTNDNGTFSLDIELERDTDSGYTSTETGTSQVQAVSSSKWENEIEIIAVDSVGLASDPVSEKIEYSICGHGHHWDVEITDITPDILIPRMILEGYAQFAFAVNLKWQGPGASSDATIDDVDLRDMPLNQLEEDNYDEEWVGHIDEIVSPDGRSAYFLINVKTQESPGNTTLEQENNLSEHRLGDCLLPGYGCMKVPFMLEISYAYADPYARSSWKNITSATQKQCWDVEIAIDRRFPSDKIPKSLLEGTIELINATLEVIDALIEPVRTARKYVFIACVGSWVLYWIKKASEWTSCSSMGTLVGSVAGAVAGKDDNFLACDPRDRSEGGTNDEAADSCRSCLEARKSTIEFFEKTQWLCDRIMCPAAPSLTKYIRDARNLETSHCKDKEMSDIDYENKADDKYRDDKLLNIEVRPRFADSVEIGAYGDHNPDYCEAEYVKEYDSVSVFMNELRESKCLTQSGQSDPYCGGIRGATRMITGICSGNNRDKIVIAFTPTGSKVTNYYIIDEFTGPRVRTNIDESKMGTRAAWEADKRENYQCEQSDYYSGDCEVIGTNHSIIFVKRNPSNPILKPTDCFEGEAPREYTAYKNQRGSGAVPETVWNEVCYESDDYVVDPTSGIIRAFQSVCLTAMYSYLKQWQEILRIARACFTTILITGDGSAGVCKQFISVYLCDLIYYAIKCIVESAGKGYGAGHVGEGFTGFLKYVSDAGASTENAISKRYGDSQVFKSMFVEKKLVHSICLYAFTGDWTLDIEGMLDSEAATPIATQCFITGNRRFITSDPSEAGRATFLYHMAPFIISGANDLRYTVELVCSADNSCDRDIDSNGVCDCLKKDGVEEARVIKAGLLNQGDSINEEIFERVPNHPVRYNKARILISYEDNQGRQIQNEVCAELDIGRIGSAPPAHCMFDMADLEYHCQYQWGEHGYAYFSDVKMDKTSTEYYVGDTVSLEGKIRKVSASSTKSEDMVLRYDITRTNGDSVLGTAAPKEVNLGDDGEVDLSGLLPTFTITDQSAGENEFNPFVSGFDSSIGTKINPQGEVRASVTPAFEDSDFSPISIKIHPDDSSYEVIRGYDQFYAEEKSGDYYSGIELIANHGTPDAVMIRIDGNPESDTTIEITPPDKRASKKDNAVVLYYTVSLHLVDSSTHETIPEPIYYNRKTQEIMKSFTAYNSRSQAADEGTCQVNVKLNEPCDCAGTKDCGSASNEYCCNIEDRPICRTGGCDSTPPVIDECVFGIYNDPNTYNCEPSADNTVPNGLDNPVTIIKGDYVKVFMRIAEPESEVWKFEAKIGNTISDSDEFTGQFHQETLEFGISTSELQIGKTYAFSITLYNTDGAQKIYSDIGAIKVEASTTA